MAVLGKIRSKGILLVSIIGLGLFAFIAEEAFRSCEASKNNERQQIGVVLGEKMTYEEFQKLVDEYSDVIKMMQGKENFTEDELNSLRDQVWNSYVQSKLIEEDAKKLGLRVTDDEIRAILNEGTNQMLLQTPFVNQQTGRFDANQLKQFLSEYKKNTNPQLQEQYQKIYNYWNFIEKSLRQQILAQKYQTLLASTFLSNPVEAQQAFNEANEEADIDLIAFPYSSVKDADIKVTDADLKSKYEELKPTFQQYEESRDIKYVSVKVNASATDKSELLKKTNEYAKALASAEDPAEAVRKSGSIIPYLGVPVNKNAFPTDVQLLLDSIAVGSTTAVKENAQDNTLNALRLISRAQLPDSIQFQAIQVGGNTPEEAHKRADSIYAALSADASQWEAIAKKYGQTGEKTWMTTQQYQYAPSLDKDTKNYLNVLNNAGVGELKNIATNGGNIIVKVSDRKAMTTKYIAAVIKTEIAFSKDTYSKAYNKFSQYVSENQTIEVLEKNAKKYGYTLETLSDVVNSQHNVANIHSTHEALKWIFDAKEGNVSPLYECGDNDNLLVVGLTKIHKKGYRDLDDPMVKEKVKAEVVKDKKAEKLIAEVSGIKNAKEAIAKGAKVSSVNQVSFAAPVFVAETGASEPALSGAVAATGKGKFSTHPVKGNAGVYLFSKKNVNKRSGVKFNDKQEESKLAQRHLQMASGFMGELFIKADVVDNRYLFF
ncbi:MAG: SurA N-terminal domain-containing protein [Prevotella sp.]|nr:SurA N-terminal domain-containing protein [Prevotella sp.]